MKRKRIVVAILALLLTLFAGVLIAGSIATAPVQKSIGNPPADTNARVVQFRSESGANIHGWFIPGQKGAGAVILMHGVRSNRLSMLDRARFLSRAGFTVLLFDFQSHGESSGEHITFGYLESRDAQAAVEFVRANAPGEKIGVIGVSMGGAATLLSSPSLDVDAMVLEMVYPTIDEAASNRITMRLGSWARILSPALTLQLKPRLGITPEMLRPIDKVGAITIPKLFIAGGDDRHTTLPESQRMFAAAAEPKELWIAQGVGHVDLHAKEKDEYEQRILIFFRKSLF